MKRRILVVSDLHLGGQPADATGVGFQICPPDGQRRLSEFFDWAAAQAESLQDDEKLQLVLNGDIVDFLAEADGGVFSAFTSDQASACRKLDAIFRSTRGVWDALGRYLATRSSLILLLGNHDVELTLPLVRRKLLDELGGGQVEFLYDNEALNFGPVLIEHGNRYDDWNAAFHGPLRQLRSALSRRLEELPEVPLQPGSDLVVRVMNDIKRKYAFVDLLKPERAGVLPLLAFLEPGLWRKAQQGVRATLRQALVRRTSDGDPRSADLVAGFDADDDMFTLAQQIAAGGNPDQVSSDRDQPSFAERWLKAANDAVRAAQLASLHRALRALVDKHTLTFAVDREDAEYLKPARARARAGFQLVVFGHTHLAKDVPLPAESSRYLNTGTWVDLMRIPDELFQSSPAAQRSLATFAEALAKNEIAPWRRRAPTYADILLDGDRLLDAGVFFFDGPGAQAPLDSAGLARRLAS